MAGGGTEKGRMAYGSAYLDSPLSPPPLKEKLPVEGDGGGTFNHGFLLQMNGYVSGSHRGREMLKEGLELQRQQGHCCRGEQIETNSASHGQLNEAAAGVSLYHAALTANGPIIEELRDWWWTEMTLCQACLIPGAEAKPYKKGEFTVWGPGWRGTVDGAWTGGNGCRDLCFRLIYGLPVPKASRGTWSLQYNLAARALSLLPPAELKALRPAPGWIPPLPYAFHARRSSTAFRASFDAPEGQKDVARTAGYAGGKTFVSEGRIEDQAEYDGEIDFPGLRE